MTLVDFIASTDRHGRLMLAYAQGDAAAFEELYAHYRAPLYRFFARQCGSRAKAEELYQELWMRVIQHRASYRMEARFSTWLYRIAHNLLVDQHRKREARGDSDGLDELEAEPGADPAQQYVAFERLSRFQLLLASLPEDQRRVFLLKEEGGLSLEEIAQVTGAGFESVKSRLRYAVLKLRQALTDAA
jgi:RNA polymerase sigma-70 factor (ECF subfamily)